MSSILTNNGAMVALQTLKSINSSMAKTQAEIATGKAVANAKDNAAVWAISKTMETDVEGFKNISDSLALGQSTVAVARQAAETVTDLLKQMKGKVVAGQAQNVDRVKLGADITALKEQIGSVVKAAQFNGLNLVDGTTATMNVLSSLDRSGSTVTASSIAVAGVNLSQEGYTAKAAFSTGTGVSTAQDAAAFTLSAGATETITIDAGAGFAAGDKISIRIGNKEASYTFSANDVAAGNTPADLAAVGLKNAVEAMGIAGLEVDYDQSNPGELSFTNTAGNPDLTIGAQFKDAGSGDLSLLSQVDLAGNLTTSLGRVESLISTTVDAAASFGSAQSRIETQASFVGKLSDSLKSGIGSMVDADMEETSARLQALQTQQQLGIQALSIANQAPQSVLSLFR